MIFRSVLWVASVALLSGCATVRLHFGGPQAQERTSMMGQAPRYVYAGTQVDAQNLAAAFPGRTSGDALYDGFNKMFFFIPLFDLPLSLVADTVFLPYDLYRVTLGGQTRYGDDEAPKTNSSVRADARR